MPKKSSAPKKRRASTAGRTIRRTATRARRRVSHGMQQHGGLLTKALFFLGGYLLGNTLEDTGIASTIRDRVPLARELIQNGYNTSGMSGGVTLTKTAGVAAFAHALYSARKSGKPNMNELAFAVGAIADDPTYGATSGQPGSGGPLGYWSS